MAKRVVPPFRRRKKMPVPSFGANLPPIETTEQARRAIAAALYFTKGKGPRRRMFALTTLLNRAAKARNPEPMALIDAQRQKIILAGKPRAKGPGARHAALLKEQKIQLSARTKGYISRAESLLRSGKKWDFVDTFLKLHKKIPKKECGVVAQFFESKAIEFNGKVRTIKSRKKRDAFMGTVSNLYLVTQGLYEKGGLKSKAKEIHTKLLRLERDLLAGH